MAVQSLQYATQLTTVETIDSGAPAAASGQNITQAGYNTRQTLTSSTTPPVASGIKANVVLSSGSATIDLTNLTGINGEAVSGSGLRVRSIKFAAGVANVNAITVAKGVSNGYTGLGSSFSVTLPGSATASSGAEFCFFDAGAGGVISGTNKTLALTGTGSTDNVNFEVVFGT